MEFEIYEDGRYTLIEISHNSKSLGDYVLPSGVSGEDFFSQYLNDIKIEFFDVLGVSEWWITDREGIVIEGAFYDIEEAKKAWRNLVMTHHEV